ncbi:MAG: Imm6 family immunity protein [Clostridium sp.]|nr:Imm6 family immunity protein [Clostridium sp.]
MELNEFKGNMKVVLGIVISEKVFKVIDENDNRYAEGREALDKCWLWVEDNLNIARVWSLLVDTVAYTSWAAYMKENAKYLPQMLDGIEEESIIVLIESALKTGFISQEEVDIIMKQVLQYFKLVMGNSVDKKEIMKNMEEMIC